MFENQEWKGNITSRNAIPEKFAIFAIFILQGIKKRKEKKIQLHGQTVAVIKSSFQARTNGFPLAIIQLLQANGHYSAQASDQTRPFP